MNFAVMSKYDFADISSKLDLNGDPVGVYYFIRNIANGKMYKL